MPRSRSGWWRAILLGAARFVVALIIFGTAWFLSRSWFRGLERMPVWLVLVTSAVVGAVFWVTRKPLQLMIDRLVLGDRADGYAQVRALLQRMATTLPVDEVVPALAETAGRTVHSSRAEVRLNMSDGDWSRVWPPPSMADGFRGIGRTIGVEVRHAGREVGEIEVDVTEPDEADRDQRLLDDLARPAGLALSTVRLTLELRRRAAELQTLTDALVSSNRRIMLARESELARIDEEVQDRVLPYIDRAGVAVAEGLDTAAAEVAGALESLRILARGIYPPRLADAGLAVSLEGWQHRAGVSVDLRVSGHEPVLHEAPELEACLYFCLVTTLGSLAAGPDRPLAVVEIHSRDVSWHVAGTVGASGRAQALQAVRDRVEAFGGSMWVDEEPAERESVRAVVPLPHPPLMTIRPATTADGNPA